MEVYATTSSTHHVPALRALGVVDVLHTNRAVEGVRANDAFTDFAKAVGGFDFVLDAFFDLHLQRSVEVLNPGGAYVMCGLAGRLRLPSRHPPRISRSRCATSWST